MSTVLENLKIILDKIIPKLKTLGFLSFSLFLMISISLGQLSNVSVSAAESDGKNVFGSVGFSECTIKPSTSQQANSDGLQKCMMQIIQFVFIFSLFIVAVRIGLEALVSMNPLEKGKAIDTTFSLVKDVTTGLMLLGSPAIFLSVFNQTTLDLSIIFNLKPSAEVAPKPNPGGGSGDGEGQNNTNGDGEQNPTTNNNSVASNAKTIKLNIGGKDYSLTAEQAVQILKNESVTGFNSTTLPDSVKSALKTKLQTIIGLVKNKSFKNLNAIVPNTSMDEILLAYANTAILDSAIKSEEIFNIYRMTTAIERDLLVKSEGDNIYTISNIICDSDISTTCKYRVKAWPTGDACKNTPFKLQTEPITVKAGESFNTTTACYVTLTV
jgi:hypothetical protein